MQPSTRQHLLAAMHRAAFTFARYRLCAVQARQNGRDDLAALFDETADEAYFDHLAKEAVLGELVATEAENLHQLIEEETRDVDTVYRIFATQAGLSATTTSQPASAKWPSTNGAGASGCSRPCARSTRPTQPSSRPVGVRSDQLPSSPLRY